MDTSQATQFEHMEAVHFQQAPGPERHIACNPCRESKVKCDGRRPVCRRCRSTQAAWKCSYARDNPRRGRPKKSGRVAPAVPPPTTTSGDSSTSHTSTTGPLGWFDEPGSGDGSDARSLSTAVESWPAVCHLLYPGEEVLGDEDCSPAECLDMVDTEFEDLRAALLVEIAPSDGLPLGLTKTLVSNYYGSHQQTFRCFEDQESLDFYRELPGYEAIALKYAVCAHAALSATRARLALTEGVSSKNHSPLAVSSKSDYAGLFYRLARAALNQSDLSKKSTVNLLQTLQATILIGLYELQQAEISLAWLSETRAVWLMEELQLYSLDVGQDPPWMNEKHTQAARRAFWAAMGLASFLVTVSQHSRIMPRPIDEITTRLPGNNQATGLSVIDVCHGAIPRLLSIDEGLTAIRVLSARVLMHASHVNRRRNSTVDGKAQAYNFWTQQSNLEESLSCLQAFTETWTTGPTNVPDFGAVLLDLHARALAVILGEAKLAKMSSSQGMGFDSGQFHLCSDAARQDALSSAVALEALDKTIPRDAATDLLLPWAAYVTLQSLLRCQSRKQTNWLDVDAVASNSPAALLSPKIPTAPALFDALVLDSFESLQARLTSWATEIPVASLYSDQIQFEIDSTPNALQMRVIGLAESLHSLVMPFA